MSRLGVGVMIGMLSGNGPTVDALRSAIGKKIEKATVDGDDLVIKLTDGSGVRLWDGGQSCCEIRYMRTDDDLSKFVGAEVLGFETADAPSIEGDGFDLFTADEEHEVQFLNVKTSLGVLTVSNHNEHNGYYGGFHIQAEALPIAGRSPEASS